jgi:hypothetical protein
MIWFLPGHVKYFRPNAIFKETGNVGATGTSSSDPLSWSILGATPIGEWMPYTTENIYMDYWIVVDKTKNNNTISEYKINYSQY